MRPLLLSILAALALPSCASLFNSPNQFLSINSTPPASLILDGKLLPMKSPAVIKVSRSKNGHMLRLEAPGYQPAELFLIPRESAYIYLNILLGGIPGVIIDASTGAMWYYDDLSFNLAPLSSKLKK